jgi:hypothetical protein
VPVGEDAEVQRADDAADEVDADHVEGVVEAELELQVDRELADERRRSGRARPPRSA